MGALSTLVAASATFCAVPLVVTARGTHAALSARRDEPAPSDATPSVEPIRYLDAGPPQVEIYGFRHQDVVIDVYRGWTGTVHHTRKISSTGAAVVRWHGSFAESPLRDVAHALQLTARRR